jgi:hypothetical protein
MKMLISQTWLIGKQSRRVMIFEMVHWLMVGDEIGMRVEVIVNLSVVEVIFVDLYNIARTTMKLNELAIKMITSYMINQ